MTKSVLLVVHPGYAKNRNQISDSGSYEAYLAQVRDAVWSRRSSVLFLYKRDGEPFALPRTAEVMRDPDRGYWTKRLVQKLKQRRVERVDICGEYLYYFGNRNLNKNLERYAAALPKKKRNEFEKALARANIIDTRFAKRLKLNPDDFFGKVFFDGNEFVDGCVIKVYEELVGKFSNVEIKRELCYPPREMEIGSRKKWSVEYF